MGGALVLGVEGLGTLVPMALALFALFTAKSVTAGEREQEGAGWRKRRRGISFCSLKLHHATIMTTPPACGRALLRCRHISGDQAR